MKNTNEDNIIYLYSQEEEENSGNYNDDQNDHQDEDEFEEEDEESVKVAKESLFWRGYFKRRFHLNVILVVMLMIASSSITAIIIEGINFNSVALKLPVYLLPIILFFGLGYILDILGVLLEKEEPQYEIILEEIPILERRMYFTAGVIFSIIVTASIFLFIIFYGKVGTIEWKELYKLGTISMWIGFIYSKASKRNYNYCAELEEEEEEEEP